MVTEEFVRTEYPLHFLVWHNDYEQLEELLKMRTFDKEQLDNRGRTPLLLAVTLGHIEATRVLLHYNANVNHETSDGWTVLQEAVSTGDPDMVRFILEKRDLQRYSNRMVGIPGLLQRLKEAPDFYVEMKWEFTSWVPLVSRMCPSDTYKVYKQGSNVRIDTTLIGLGQNSWQRGNRSYIFLGRDDYATMMEVNHDTHEIFSEDIKTAEEAFGVLPTDSSVMQRLTAPIVSTYVDTEKISFERDKTGVWGWRSDKSEVVNGYNCKVFNATNVELVTKTRTEHLTDIDKAKNKNSKTPLQSFLNIADVENCQVDREVPRRLFQTSKDGNITLEEYFDSKMDLGDKDIGRPREMTIKVQKFKANLWLCEQYPLSLPEQILPIVDLMAISSSHFSKLKDFIQMQLPSGFPVKIEIPIFHILHARITFGNIFATDVSIENVRTIEEEDRLTCVLDESIFQPPPSYTHGRNEMYSRTHFPIEDDDDLLEFAIQKSLLDMGKDKEEMVDIWEALDGQRNFRPMTPTSAVDNEERELQRAIEDSLQLYHLQPGLEENVEEPEIDTELTIALRLSEEESRKEENARIQEEKLLEQVLQLSLNEQ